MSEKKEPPPPSNVPLYGVKDANNIRNSFGRSARGSQKADQQQHRNSANSKKESNISRNPNIIVEPSSASIQQIYSSQAITDIPTSFVDEPNLSKNIHGDYSNLFSIRQIPSDMQSNQKKKRSKKHLKHLIDDLKYDFHQQPYTLLENIIKWDPKYKKPILYTREPVCNMKLKRIPKPERLSIFDDFYQPYAFDHYNRLLELSFLKDGFGYRFEEIFMPERFGLILDFPWDIWDRLNHNCYWIKIVKSSCRRVTGKRPSEKYLRRLVRDEVLHNWDFYKIAIYMNYRVADSTLFPYYNPFSKDENEQEVARNWYATIHNETFTDFHFIEVAICCKLFKICLTVLETTLDHRYFIRKVIEENTDKPGLFIWAKEIRERFSKFLDYDITILRPIPCNANDMKYNLLQNCELYLTFFNPDVLYIRLTQVEYTQRGLYENFQCYKTMKQRKKKQQTAYLKKNYEDLDIDELIAKDKEKGEEDVDDDYNELKPELDNVTFDRRVQIKWYPCVPLKPKRNLWYKRIKRWTGISCDCLKFRSVGHHRDDRHKVCGVRTLDGHKYGAITDTEEAAVLYGGGDSGMKQPRPSDARRVKLKPILRRGVSKQRFMTDEDNELPRKPSGMDPGTFKMYIPIYQENEPDDWDYDDDENDIDSELDFSSDTINIY